MSVDLHVHSVASDGTHSAEQLIAMARSADLRAIAITDHDSVDSVDPALAAAGSFDVEVVPAIELSSHIGEHDVHILGYFLDWRNKELAVRLSELREARVARAVKMIELLRRHGVEISTDELLERAGLSAVGRPHVAALLVDKGFAASVSEAFEKFLARGASCYVEKTVLTTSQIIRLIRNLGGVPVLAHPGVSRVDAHIEDLAAQGLQGIEAFHADHSLEQIQEYRSLAERLGMVVTGGSDFHGKEIRGLGIGVIDVPDWVLYALKNIRAES